MARNQFSLIARWAAGLIGLLNASITLWELFTRPDKDVLVSLIGAYVSLHGIYLGFALVAFSVMVGAAWPLVLWIWETPKRTKERAKRNQEQEMQKQINDLQDVIDIVKRTIDDQFESMFGNDVVNKISRREILIKKKVIPESYRDKENHELKKYLENILPYIIRFGIEDGVAQYKKKRSE